MWRASGSRICRWPSTDPPALLHELSFVKIQPSMKILIDFFPILLFFGAYKVYDIYVATGVLMATTLIQMGLIYTMDRKLQAMHKITLLLVLIFGTLTLALHDDRFIKWKPTVLYAAMAVGSVSYTHLTLPTNREV